MSDKRLCVLQIRFTLSASCLSPSWWVNPLDGSDGGNGGVSFYANKKSRNLTRADFARNYSNGVRNIIKPPQIYPPTFDFFNSIFHEQETRLVCIIYLYVSFSLPQCFMRGSCLTGQYPVDHLVGVFVLDKCYLLTVQPLDSD